MSREFEKFSSDLQPMSAFDNDAAVRKSVPPAAATRSKPTRKQAEALREARKEKRGRGKSLGERRNIIVRVTPNIDKAIADAMYETGRTQNDVICDALMYYLKIDK